MKTALDALMEALEADAWAPPAGSGVGPPQAFRASLAESKPATTQHKPPSDVRPATATPTQEDYSMKALARCGSASCAGCYVVDAQTGAKIHPPKCGDDYKTWLERWEAKSRPQ
jgi:hypothetical protein